jgi:hypothetical protein
LELELAAAQINCQIPILRFGVAIAVKRHLRS